MESLKLGVVLEENKKPDRIVAVNTIVKHIKSVRAEVMTEIFNHFRCSVTTVKYHTEITPHFCTVVTIIMIITWCSINVGLFLSICLFYYF